MKLAIVGSVSLAGNPVAAQHIEDMLDEYQPTLVVSGGADGIDTMAVDAAKQRGIETREHLPKTRRWHDGFKPRNMLIAHDCDVLVRIVSSNSKTYGSGWTRDYARDELGRETREFVVSVPDEGAAPKRRINLPASVVGKLLRTTTEPDEETP